MVFRIENGVLTKYTEENSVTEVTIPDGVTKIGEKAFEHCTGLEKIEVPEGVTEIGAGDYKNIDSVFQEIDGCGYNVHKETYLFLLSVPSFLSLTWTVSFAKKIKSINEKHRVIVG